MKVRALSEEGPMEHCWGDRRVCAGVGADVPAPGACRGTLLSHPTRSASTLGKLGWTDPSLGDQRCPPESPVSPERASTHTARPGTHVRATVDGPARALLVQLLVLALEDLLHLLLAVGTDGGAARRALLPAGRGQPGGQQQGTGPQASPTPLATHHCEVKTA